MGDSAPCSLRAEFNRLDNCRLWAEVRQLAIRGTVPNPSLEPPGTAVKGLFECIESNALGKVLAMLRQAGHALLAEDILLMMKRSNPDLQIDLE